MVTWGYALEWAIEELGGKQYTIDCLRLLTDDTDLNLMAVYDLQDKEFHSFSKFKQFVLRRKSGEPVAYITGRQDFWKSSFRVTPDVLIPRQDTELILEALLAIKFQPKTILELGVGSGALIISYLLENRDCKGYASDISHEALAVASLNAERLLSEKINFKQGSWFEPWQDHKFDAIVVNPPYIPESDPCLSELTFEPMQALVSHEYGLKDLKSIITVAYKYLNPHGYIIIEHGYNQYKALNSIIDKEHYPFFYGLKDINGKDRVIVLQSSASSTSHKNRNIGQA